MYKASYLSYWEQKHFFNADVAIVGSGIVGLSAAIFVKKRFPHKSVVVLEKSPIPHGATTRNAGFACFGSAGELHEDWQQLGKDKLLELVAYRVEGLRALENLHSAAAIQLEKTGGYELFTTSELHTFTELIPQLETLNAFLMEAKLFKQPVFEVVPHVTHQPWNFKHIAGVIKNSMEGMLDSGALALSLLHLCAQHGIRILNGCEVLNFQLHAGLVELELAAPFEMFKAEQVLVCTNGFAGQLFPQFDVKPARGQVLITKPISNLPWSGTFHHEKGYNYFRNVGSRVLIGGGRHLDFAGETTTEMQHTERIQNYLIHLLQTHILPDTPFEIERAWAGIMGVGATRYPIIESIHAQLHVGIRMGGMGVAIGTEVGRRLAQRVL